MLEARSGRGSQVHDRIREDGRESLTFHWQPQRLEGDYFPSTPFRATVFGNSVGLPPDSSCSVKSSRSSIDPR